MAKDELTPQQEQFVKEYIIDLNGTQAAIRAGYSSATAGAQASRLLKDVKIQTKIQEAMEARSQRVEVDADWVLRRLVKLADYDTKDFAKLVTKTITVKPKGGGEPVDFEVQDVEFMEDFDGKITGGLSKGKDGIKLELPDRQRALELIGRHLGMFKDVVKHTGSMHHTHTDLSHLSDEELEAELKKQRGEG